MRTLLRETRRQTQSPRRGAAMVEMALVLPIFVSVTLGIIELGRAMMVGQIAQNAAKEGTRTGIITGNSNAQVRAEVKAYLNKALGLAAADVTTTITVQPYEDNPDAANEVSEAHSRDLVTVTVQVPYDKVTFIRAKWLTGKKLTGVCAMRHL